MPAGSSVLPLVGLDRFHYRARQPELRVAVAVVLQPPAQPDHCCHLRGDRGEDCELCDTATLGADPGFAVRTYRVEHLDDPDRLAVLVEQRRREDGVWNVVSAFSDVSRE